MTELWLYSVIRYRHSDVFNFKTDFNLIAKLMCKFCILILSYVKNKWIHLICLKKCKNKNDSGSFILDSNRQISINLAKSAGEIFSLILFLNILIKHLSIFSSQWILFCLNAARSVSESRYPLFRTSMRLKVYFGLICSIASLILCKLKCSSAVSFSISMINCLVSRLNGS